LGLALRALVYVHLIGLENIQGRNAFYQGIAEGLKAYELQVISGSVVLRVLSERGSHHAAHRKIKTGGAELAFVISVRIKICNVKAVRRVFEEVTKDSIDLGIAAASPLVGKSSLVSDTGNHDTVYNR
jgi:hypothetical protein